MSVGVSVIVPVGPQPEYRKYIDECIYSITEQTCSLDEIILIDDMSHFETWFWGLYDNHADLLFPCPVRVIKNLWLSGCAQSWNFGVASSRNDLCLLMGSDDRLYPDCLDELREAYAAHDYLDAWYNLTISITEGPDVGIHSVFNNAAAVTRGLWGMTGGFPPSAGVGAPDALLISIMLVHMPERLIQVKEGVPLYWCRHHNAQDTPRQAGFFNWEVIQIRDKETQRWQKPTWTG